MIGFINELKKNRIKKEIAQNDCVIDELKGVNFDSNNSEIVELTLTNKYLYVIINRKNFNKDKLNKNIKVEINNIKSVTQEIIKENTKEITNYYTFNLEEMFQTIVTDCKSIIFIQYKGGFVKILRDDNNEQEVIKTKDFIKELTTMSNNKEYITKSVLTQSSTNTTNKESFNDKFIDTIDKINDKAISLGFKNGLDFFKYASKNGEISRDMYMQYDILHGLRKGISHGHADESNININTYNSALQYLKIIKNTKIRNKR